MKATRLALIGNPNAGKSSILTSSPGFAKDSKFPGVTVEKKTGSFHLGSHDISVTDLPGTYSLFPNSKDENSFARYFVIPTMILFPIWWCM